MSTLVAAALLPALVAFAVIALLRRAPWVHRLADHPNERSLHAVPTPRLGGLGIAAGIAPFAFLPHVTPLWLILGCALFLFLVSLADDVRSLPVEVRLGAHVIAAVIALVEPWVRTGMVSALSMIWLALAIAWMTNLYNFMDGADGLAGAMALLGFGTYAAAAAMGGHASLAILCAAIASASAGFLAHNLPPARVFMGDAGSIPLGFLAAALGLHGWLAGAWPLAFPVLAFLPFIADASTTLARRALNREPVWRAHRSHHYQRLVLAGWSRRRLLFTSAVLMAASAASALASLGGGLMLQCGIIFVWAAFYALAFLAIDRLTTRTAGTTQ